MNVSGAVVAEHQHRWRLGDEDEDGVHAGMCVCGVERVFRPFSGKMARVRGLLTAQQRRDFNAPPRACSVCHVPGHSQGSCPLRRRKQSVSQIVDVRRGVRAERP